ncbi:MAG TPA: DUF4136 domain-containing protein [Terriglobales bacterium]|nr:DUF4136 domain-containing protein [Terriglobales bacterium]
MRRFPLLCAFLLALIACKTTPLEVRYNFDRNADFSKFKTYKWVTLKDTAKIDMFRDKQIKDRVDAELARKRMTKTDADTADLYLGYQAGVDAQRQFATYKVDWGHGSGWSGGWYSGVGGMVTEQTAFIYIGQLAVDMYDATNHSLVWRGVANKTIDPNATPEKQQKNLAKAVAKLLINYPPPSPEGNLGARAE